MLGVPALQAGAHQRAGAAARLRGPSRLAHERATLAARQRTGLRHRKTHTALQPVG